MNPLVVLLLVAGGWFIFSRRTSRYRLQVYDAGGGVWQFAIYQGDEIVWQQPDDRFGSELSARAAGEAKIAQLLALEAGA